MSDSFFYLQLFNDTVDVDGKIYKFFNNTANEVLIKGTDSDDFIENYGTSVMADALNGDDYINNYGAYCSISGNDGNDFVYNYGSNATIGTGVGKDTVTNISNALVMKSGDDDDYIYNEGSNVTIDAEDGDDYIIMEEYSYIGGYNIIRAGAGNDTVKNLGRFSTINAGAGDDIVSIGNKHYADLTFGESKNIYQYSAGDGNDTIYHLNGDDTIQFNSGEISYNAEKITVEGSDILTVSSVIFSITSNNESGSVLVTEPNGKNINLVYPDGSSEQFILIPNLVYNTDSFVTVSGEDSVRNYIINIGNNNVITAGNNNDFIENYGTSTDIFSGNGNDSINNQVNNVTVNGGVGKDTVLNNYNSSEVLINSGEDEDYIENRCSNVTVNGGAGNDYIFNDASNVTINAGEDNDTISNGNSDNDNIFMDCGAGNDYIHNYSSNVTLKGGDGNDSIRHYYSSYADIDGGNGDDYIYIYGGSNFNPNIDITVHGGIGNDTINNSRPFSGRLYLYNSGDGSDVIIGMTSSDTLIIDGTTYSTLSSGNDLIVTAGNGAITLQGALTLKSFNIVEIEKIPDGVSLKNGTLTVTKNFAGDTIDLTEDWAADVKKTNATAFSKPLTIIGKDTANSIKGGRGADTISGGLSNDTIYGSSGNDSIFGGEGNDLLKGDAGIDTIDGGTGTNTLTGGAGKDVFIHSEGEDVITDYVAGQDKIMVNTITGDSLKGSDIILFTDNGNVTVKGGKNKKITVIDGENNSTTKVYGQYNYSESNTKLTLTSGFNGTLNADDYDSAVEEINATVIIKSGSINGNGNNNVIIGSARNDSINGNGERNTLTGANGNDVFIHEKGDDYITDYTVGKDKIKLLNVTITSASLDEDNLILQTTDGTITVAEGKGKKITVVDAKNKTTTAEYPLFLEGLMYDKKNVVLTATTDFSGETIDLTDYYSTTTRVNANAVKTAISIYGNDSNNSIKGGKGSDTIYGGVGNDTITGGTGKDVFVYEKGNDVITDYKAGQDKIKFENVSITGSTIKSSNVILQTDEGTLTIKSGRNKKITVIDSNGNETTQIYGNSFNYESSQLIEEDLLSDFANGTDDIFQNENAAAIDELSLYQNLNATTADGNFNLLNDTPPTAYQQKTHYYKNYAADNA